MSPLPQIPPDPSPIPIHSALNSLSKIRGKPNMTTNSLKFPA